MSSHASLDAAAQERKARLAKLKSLKRKAPDAEGLQAGEQEVFMGGDDALPSTAVSYVSGRNYDPETRGPKLGFENNPAADQDTTERRAKELADAAKAEAAKEEQEAEKPLDLFKLQPRKPNWDLKRDVEKRMEKLNVQTENAIARLVRERIDAQKKKETESQVHAMGEPAAADDAQGGLKGEELVSALHAKEQQEEEEERRAREEDAEEEDGF